MKPAWCFHPLQLVLGLTVWAVWFVLAYGGVSLACVLLEPPVRAGVHSAVNVALLALTGATVVLLAWWTWACATAAGRQDTGQPRRFVALLAAALHGSAALATVFVAVPLWMLPPCR